MAQDHSQPSPLSFALAGNIVPSYCGSGAEEPNGTMGVGPQKTEGVISVHEEESVPGAS